MARSINSIVLKLEVMSSEINHTAKGLQMPSDTVLLASVHSAFQKLSEGIVWLLIVIIFFYSNLPKFS